jgi:hypothetical protein
MSAENPSAGARLRAARKARGLVVSDLAALMRDTAEHVRARLPKLRDIERTIRGHEADDHAIGPRHRLLYARALDMAEDELFPPDSPHPVPAAPAAPEADRIRYVIRRPAGLDDRTVDALAGMLAGQRHLEDVIGPGPLLTPVCAQLPVLLDLLRDAPGRHRRALAAVTSEWAAFAGWLHAALRHDEEALSLFQRAEDLADDAEDGTLAATATSFRGYVARMQGRPRAVIRWANAALATPGAHRGQRAFDTMQAARGHALMGDDPDQVRRLLDQATALADGLTDPPPSVYWYSEPFFRVWIGVTQLEMGQPRVAADMLSSGLAAMPEAQRTADWAAEYRDALTAAQAAS